MNLGAGAIVKQDLARIDDAVADGSFFENEALLAACKAARESPRGRLHLMGLVSDGGVHSGWEHIEALIELAAREGVPGPRRPRLHRRARHFPESSAGYIPELERWLRQAGRIGTVSGRYYAMDRDTRWERTKLAYDALVHAQGVDAADGGGGGEGRARGRGDRRVHQAGRDRRLRRHGARRRPRPFQLPPGPHAPARPRTGRAGLRRSSRAPARRSSTSRRSPSTARAGRIRSRSRPSRPRRPSPRSWRTPAQNSSTSPRPRSTPTSPTSSTAGARRSGRGRSAASSSRRATSPPTTKSPR